MIPTWVFALQWAKFRSESHSDKLVPVWNIYFLEESSEYRTPLPAHDCLNQLLKFNINSFASRVVFFWRWSRETLNHLWRHHFLTTPDCFDEQLTQQGQIHPYVCPFWISTKFWQSYPRKNVSNFGCKNWW